MKNGRNTMPELPEVQTITSDLKKYLMNAIIKKIEIEKDYIVWSGNENLLNTVVARRITNVSRIAKNINLELSNDFHILIHLAMTGQVLIRKPNRPKDRFQRVIIVVEVNNQIYHIRFCDMRMFGKVILIPKSDLSKFEQKYGYDALNMELTPEILLKNLKLKKTSIKNALLDQANIAGLGNIYATDTLFLSGTHPETSTHNISVEDTRKILENARLVLNESIKNRGSTLGDKMYVDAFGHYGKHQNFFRIYNKSKCPNCHAKTEFKKINGRGTYFCPVCQPIK